MNRRNRNKSRSERGKPTFKATTKAKAFSPRKTRLSKNDKKKLVETVKAEVAESSKSKPKEKKRGNASTQNTMNLRLTEHGAGITEYISKHEGFSAIIKQRYSDFHVNEIDCDGNVVTLTTLEAPEAPVAAAAETKEEVDDYLKTTLPEEQFKKIMELIDSNGEEVEIEATNMSKEDRRKLHTAIVKSGKSRLISNTVDKDGKKFIVVKRSSKAGKQERRPPWPADRGGEYVYFVLHKENMDTVETVNLIASRLRVKPNMITYAGMKDRRAKTSQLMCVWKVEPQRLVNVSRSLRGIELGNYSFHQRALRLGDLRGNRFRIVLRNVTGSDKQIEEGLTSLKTKGFLNYYGLQRFGSSLAVPTHEIGKALLLGNWQKAVELILKPRDGEPLRFLAEARKVWWETRDAAKAVKILRNKDKMIEGKLLLGLSRHGPKNYLNALDNIPRNTRLMYLHSYQSLIWNKVVSRRMQKFGLQPIAGDLVLQGEERAEPVELMEVGDHDATATHPASDTAEDNVSNRQKPSVRVLSESDLKDFTIYDVVLPLPGHDIVYPQNETKEWFEELLQADGLSPAKLKQSVRAYSVGGAYRRIAVRPTNVSWKIMHYSDPQTTLVLSDLEEMQKVAPPKDERNGVYKALILDFCLPSSTYATMAVREVLKSDTSCYNQALLNDYHIPTGSNGTPKRRMSSAENGDPVSSSPSDDVKMEPQDQVTSTKHQVSSICTRAAKREKKTAEPDGQMEIESMPGGETPEKSASKIEDKDALSSEVTTKTTVALPEGRFTPSEETVTMDVDKNDQQLLTQRECGAALSPSSGDKSDMEVASVTVENDVKCEPNVTKAIPDTQSKVSVGQEQLPVVACSTADLQAQSAAVIQTRNTESIVCSETHIKEETLKSEMTDGAELNEKCFVNATMSKATTSTEDELLNKQNITTGSPLTANAAVIGEETIAVSLPSDDVAHEKAPVNKTAEKEEQNCILEDSSPEPPDNSQVLDGTKAQKEEHTVPEVASCSDKVSAASPGVETKVEKMAASAMTHTPEAAKLSKETNNELVPDVKDRKEASVLEAGETLVAETTSVPDDESEVKSQRPILCKLNENDRKTSEAIAETPETMTVSSETTQSMKTLTQASSLPEPETLDTESKTEGVESTAQNVCKNQESVVSQVNQCTAVSLPPAPEEIPLARTSLTADTHKTEASHSSTLMSEIDVANSVDPLPTKQDCEDKVKVTEERSPEQTEKSVPLEPHSPVPKEAETALTSEFDVSRSTKTGVDQMEKTDGVEQPLKENKSQNVEVSCMEPKNMLISEEPTLEKIEESLKSAEIVTLSTVINEESFVKEKDYISELPPKTSVNQESISISSVSRTSKETNLFGTATTKETASTKKTDSEIAETVVATSEQHSVKEKNEAETVELCDTSKNSTRSELCGATEDLNDCVKRIEQKSSKEDKVQDIKTDGVSALLSAAIQPSEEVCEEKVIENSESGSVRAVSLCSQEQQKLEGKCVGSVADGRSYEKEGTEENRTHSLPSDALINNNKNDVQHCVEHEVNSKADSERTEVSVKRKVLDCENETEISPKKVKIEDCKSVSPSSVSDAHCSPSPESLKRKSANDDTETNDQESNTEKKKLKVEMTE